MERLNELALDNLNVIYDNDNEPAELNLTSAPVNGFGQYQANKREQTNGETAPSKSGFVHSEHADGVLEQRDNYATCSLQSTKANNSLARNLVGRLNFWQPIENRGVLHMIARLQFELSNNTTAAATLTRRRRESFETLVEQVAPNQGQPAIETRKTIKIWLSNDAQESDCHNSLVANSTGSRKLFAELIWAANEQFNKTVVDIDAELVVNRFNLTAPESIIGKCLHLEHEQESFTFATCKILSSANLPPVSELEHLASLGSVQPIREELLFASAKPTPTPTTTNSGSSTSSEANSSMKKTATT